MATVLRLGRIKFKINPRDHSPPHVHVEGCGAKVRINLKTFEQMDDTRFSASSLHRIIEQVKIHSDELMAKWEEYHGEEEI